MGNDAVGFARKEACGLEGNDLRRQIDHNFDYVTCCGRAVVSIEIYNLKYLKIKQLEYLNVDANLYSFYFLTPDNHF